ncbi:MAG: hypothetical protein WC944_04220, partial [Candidatus Cloacimonadaceae bacterium]
LDSMCAGFDASRIDKAKGLEKGAPPMLCRRDACNPTAEFDLLLDSMCAGFDASRIDKAKGLEKGAPSVLCRRDACNPTAEFDLLLDSMCAGFDVCWIRCVPHRQGQRP